MDVGCCGRSPSGANRTKLGLKEEARPEAPEVQEGANRTKLGLKAYWG